MDASCWILLSDVIIATIALYIAYRQLGHVSKQLQLLRKSSTASILFELDRKYDDIFEARKAARELAEHTKQRMAADGLEGEDIYKYFILAWEELQKSKKPPE